MTAPITIVVADRIRVQQAIGVTGPQGPPGPPGAAGGSVSVYNQTTPLATWVVNHNLGRYPGGVTILDSQGNVEIADIVYGSLNTFTVTFATPQTGSAIYS